MAADERDDLVLDCVDRIRPLQAAFQDGFREIRALDEQFAAKGKEIADLESVILALVQEEQDGRAKARGNRAAPKKRADASRANADKAKLLNDCKALHEARVAAAEKKLDLATKLYDNIDGHVAYLDKALDTFEAHIRKGKFQAPATPIDMRTHPWGKWDRPWKPLDESKPEKDAGAVSNEPLYCVCHKPSFGEMIACDNPNCAVEWFHFECVGLKSQPKGQWFCPDCTVAMNTRGLDPRAGDVEELEPSGAPSEREDEGSAARRKRRKR